jgi:hypothetical protein
LATKEKEPGRWPNSNASIGIGAAEWIIRAADGWLDGTVRLKWL